MSRSSINASTYPEKEPMEGIRQAIRPWWLGAAIVVALLGCQQKTEPATAAGAAAEPVAVSEIRVGASADAPRPQSPDQPIVVHLKLKGGDRAMNAPTKLEARLIELRSGAAAGFLVKQFSGVVPPETEFSFESAKSWAEGRYAVEIKLDGKLIGQRDIDVIQAGAAP
ncbi:hypothetical protein [Lysobacter capsici]|uniref:hypothetical protein n=1 Tax=Lysobacter capsici TaxID=435897 RepID=UPI00287B7673|nr:hypothetical protein [Lysobacter capsici]WND80142.1 hypothetical protein RJ610_23155 [Lysobacter capsici]WND85338.1 hypothetical protein RJ609_23170 [Lysobacter capsici]